MITFSIITCTYNASQYIGRTLESVRRQTYPHIEHLIIDGLSKDNTVAKAQAYAKDGGTRTVSIVSERDKGLYDAMNKGIRMASGDYIIFLPPEGEVPIEIAHDYDPSDYDEADETAYAFEETEPTLSGDLSGYTGCWKLAGEPFYFVINEDYEWIAINLYGEQVGPGYVVDEGENITLCMEDDSQLVSL